MRSDLDTFSLKHRIFLVKHFYQAMGDYMCVKNKYEKYYSDEDDSPEFSNDALVEVINLFEKTGCVFKDKEQGEKTCVTRKNDRNDRNQIEQVYLRETFSEVSDETNPPLELFKLENADEDFTMMSDDFPTEDPEYLDEETGKLLSTTSEDKEIHGCEICGKVFTGLKNLTKHQQTHDNETRFTCSVKNCKKIFKQWSSYKAHKLTHDNPQPTTSRAASSDSLPGSSRESPHAITTDQVPYEPPSLPKLSSLRSLTHLRLLNISLHDIMEFAEFQRVFKFYQKRKKLDKTHRKMLVEMIVEYAIAKNVSMNCKNLDVIAEEIVEVFPTEIKETYYVPKKMHTKKGYGGILYCRYHNSKRRDLRAANKLKQEEGNDMF